jgi:type I restriction enzyme S subunit
MYFMGSAIQRKISPQRERAQFAAISGSDLRAHRLPLAPLPEQYRIVAEIEKQFTRLDAGVAALKRAQANLKRYRASVLKAACEGRLVPTEAELTRAEGCDYEPADRLLTRILKERRAKWEADQLAKMQAQGKVPKDDKWKGRYQEPATPDITNLPDLPEGWVWATVDQLASEEPRSIQSGPFGSSLLHSEFQDSGILAIGIDNVLEGRFSMGSQHRISVEKYAELEKYTARPLDVLVTVMATVGRCCVVPAGLERSIITKHVYRISANQQLINPYYMMFALRGGSEVRRQMFGQVKGQTRPGINGEILKCIALPVPPPEEQHRIVAEVERRLSVIDELEATVDANLKRAERLRQSILKRAFEGKLVPQDPDDEPASVLLERIRAERALQGGQQKATKKATDKPGSKGKRPQVLAAQGELFR